MEQRGSVGEILHDERVDIGLERVPVRIGVLVDGDKVWTEKESFDAGKMKEFIGERRGGGVSGGEEFVSARGGNGYAGNEFERIEVGGSFCLNEYATLWSTG